MAIIHVLRMYTAINFALTHSGKPDRCISESAAYDHNVFILRTDRMCPDR